MATYVQTGVDVFLSETADRFRGRRIGLITNQTGVTGQLEGDVAAFQRVFGDGLRALFGPEHGLYGHAQDRVRVASSTDPESGLPVYSLYGPGQAPPDVALQEIDTLIFDIQDVGVRFYTYLTSMLHTLRAAASHHIPVTILDRPNPITGVRVAGPVLSPSFASFEGACEIPVRHGMTLGELARFLNETTGIGAEVVVTPLTGWTRPMWYEDTRLPWVPPSPNMPTVDTAVVYPGMGLFEGTNLSEGRGTTRPFELIGAPWIDSRRFAETLNRLDLPGVRFRSAHFLPTFWKLQGEMCRGVQIHVMDRARFEPLETGLAMIAVLLDLWPERFEWVRMEPDAPYFFDQLMGTDQVRVQLTTGVPAQDIIRSWRDDEQRFRKQREPFLLY